MLRLAKSLRKTEEKSDVAIRALAAIHRSLESNDECLSGLQQFRDDLLEMGDGFDAAPDGRFARAFYLIDAWLGLNGGVFLNHAIFSGWLQSVSEGLLSVIASITQPGEGRNAVDGLTAHGNTLKTVYTQVTGYAVAGNVWGHAHLNRAPWLPDAQRCLVSMEREVVRLWAVFAPVWKAITGTEAPTLPEPTTESQDVTLILASAKAHAAKSVRMDTTSFRREIETIVIVDVGRLKCSED